MTPETNLDRSQLKPSESLVSAIARETAASVEQVRALYEEEVATLSESATVRQFVGLIATKRVKQQLRALHAA